MFILGKDLLIFHVPMNKADVNIKLKVNEKENTYSKILRNLKLLYRDYKFRFISATVWSQGDVTCCLNTFYEK